MSTTRAVWIFILVLTAIRLAFLGATQLSPDEAYYWMWSQRPALSYFSKGPGVAFVIRSSTAIFGDNEFGVRFWSPLLPLARACLLYYFAQRLFSSLAGFWTVVVAERHAHFQSRQPAFSQSIRSRSSSGRRRSTLSGWRSSARRVFPGGGRSPGCSLGLVFSANTPMRSSWFRFFSSSFSPGVCGANFCGRIFTFSFLSSRFARFRPSFGIRITPGSLSRISNRAAVLTLRLGFIRSSSWLFWASILRPIRRSFFWALSGRRSPVGGARNSNFKVFYLLWFGLPVFLLYLVLSINDAAAPNWDALAFPSLGILAVSYWRERAASGPAPTPGRTRPSFSRSS